MDIELAGFVILNHEKEVLTCRYSVGEYVLYEVPTLQLATRGVLNLAQLKTQTELDVAMMERYPLHSQLRIGGVNYDCSWARVALLNPYFVSTKPNSQWHYKNLRTARLGQVTLGPYTEKLAWAIENEEISLR